MNASFLNFEAHVFQRSEFLDVGALNYLSTIAKVDGFARKVLCFSRQHFTKSRLLLLLAMSNKIALRAAMTWTDGCQSDQIGEAPFHLSMPQAKP
jgi:hypothetical protein